MFKIHIIYRRFNRFVCFNLFCVLVRLRDITFSFIEIDINACFLKKYPVYSSNNNHTQVILIL